MGGGGGPRVLIAPQNFKGTAHATEVASAIGRGLRRIWPDVVCTELPLADGGEGTVRALVHATGGEMRTARVHGPLGREIESHWGLLGDRRTAVVEMAAASGLSLLRDDQRDPRRTTTRGTGELLLAAAGEASRVIVGIGDSATNDGGAGMARALGVRFLDRTGAEIDEGGAALIGLDRIEGAVAERMRKIRVEVACDVRNPLLGPEGASAIYGPQKGATPEDVAVLERALTRYADVIERDLGKRVRDIPGSGAAGGLGAGLLAFLDATLRSGAGLILEMVGFERALATADLVITGEGRLDEKSWYGKTTHTVSEAARAARVPVALVVGSVGEGARDRVGPTVAGMAVSSELADPGPDVRELISRAAAALARQLQQEHGIG